MGLGQRKQVIWAKAIGPGHVCTLDTCPVTLLVSPDNNGLRSCTGIYVPTQEQGYIFTATH